MIYSALTVAESLSQGDILGDCPIMLWKPGNNFDVTSMGFATVIVLTQACDLAHGKVSSVVVAIVHPAQQLVDDRILKSSLVRDQVRAHRVYGWYSLPAGEAIAESLVDLRDLHTVPRLLLESLIAQGKRICRLTTPYREHMAQHFSTTYSRIALPEPYDTNA